MVGQKKRECSVNYFELPRRQLQSLCKKNGFPANKTNQLMAEFLTSHLSQARDDNLPTIPESQLKVSTNFVKTQATLAEGPLEASTINKTRFGARSLLVDDSTNFSTSGFRIRCSLHYKREAKQDIPPPTSSAYVSKDSPAFKGVRTERYPLVHLLTSEDPTTGFWTGDSSLESPKIEESPLPLSVMPYIRLATAPECQASDDEGVKLFVDLKNDSLSSLDEPSLCGTLRDYYQGRGAPPISFTGKREDDRIWGLGKCFEESERILPSLESQAETRVNNMNRAAAEGVMTNILLQTSTSSKKTDSVPLKSCSLNSKRKSSLNVAVGRSIFSSPRSFSALVPDIARSEIVQEWSTDQSQETFDQIYEISCNEDNTVYENTILSKLDEKSLAAEISILTSRRTQSVADMKSHREGLAEKVAKIYEEQTHSRGSPSIHRKACYNASPILKSSTIAAELERASKLEHARVGILAPLFSDTDDIKKQSRDEASPHNMSSSEGIVSDAKTCRTRIGSSHCGAVQVEAVSKTKISPSDMEPVVSTLSLPAVDAATQNEITTLPTEDSAEKDEPNIVGTDEGTQSTDQNVAPVSDLAKVFTTEDAGTTFSWMARRIQLPTKRQAHDKVKEKKPEPPFSTCPRTLELMETASGKLKILKKSTTVIGEEGASRLKRTISTEQDELEILDHTEELAELEIIEEAADKPLASLEKGAHDTLLAETVSKVHMVSTKSPLRDEDSCHESSPESLNCNGKSRIATEEEFHVDEDSNTNYSLSVEKNIFCEEDLGTDDKAAKRLAGPLSLIDIDFTRTTVNKTLEATSAESVLESSSAKFTETNAAAGKSVPSSPMDGQRWAIDKVAAYSSPNPTKASEILDVLSENVEKKIYVDSPTLLHGKENEWSRRQEQHKTPLTGRSKEKALRTAEKNAANFREQLLRKRRGMME